MKTTIPVDFRAVVIIMLLCGLVFNCFSVYWFRQRTTSVLDERFNAFASQFSFRYAENNRVISEMVTSLFATNMISINQKLRDLEKNSFSDFGSLGFDRREPVNPIMQQVASVPYSFYVVNGVPYARIHSENFGIGDSFPRGGRITAIYHDCLVLDGHFRVDNVINASPSLSPVVVPEHPPKKEKSEDVARMARSG